MEIAILFDIDGTLTPPRQPVNKQTVDALKSINVPFHVVAGSHFNLLREQFFNPLRDFKFQGKFDAFVSNGATQYRCIYADSPSYQLISEFNFKNQLGERDYATLVQFLEEMAELGRRRLPPQIKIVNDELIVDRVSMINFCPIGRKDVEDEQVRKNRDEFARWDNETHFRVELLDYFKQKMSDIIHRKNLSITLGGQTSFDIGIKGQDKTRSLQTLLQLGVRKLVFIGDALFPGGNDYAIQEFKENWPTTSRCPVETIQTRGWENTLSILSDLRLILSEKKI
jgi:phosphomannomutase